MGEVFVQGDVVVGVMLAGEGVEVELLQFVELGQAELGGLGVAGVAEGAEHVLVLVARKAVGVGHHGVDGRTDLPSLVIPGQYGPAERLLSLLDQAAANVKGRAAHRPPLAVDRLVRMGHGPPRSQVDG